jgi:uncharacterized protein
MRIAVIGSGISGLASAWLLSRAHEVTLFEAEHYLGGHTHTHDIELDGARYAVDTGFIVHNTTHYPLLARLFAELGVSTQPTTMSFSVRNERSGLEYNTNTLNGLFCQRRNLFRRRFLAMLRDLARFYREAPALLAATAPGPALGDYLDSHGYGSAFRDDHLVPMAAALWSAPAAAVLSFPVQFLVRFMANHEMLTLRRRPVWRVVCGGSARYVDLLRRHWNVRERRGCPAHSLERDAAGVTLTSAAGRERYDHAVLACHSDQALKLLAAPDVQEESVLGAIGYQSNEVVLHTDARVLPRDRRAWAAWNAWVPREPAANCTVSYCMNLLQGLTAPRPLLVTLNRTAAIDPAHVLRTLRYSHPLFTAEAVAAQTRRAEIQGRRRTWFAGAYWGFGFHEDGIKSAVEVARAFGIRWGGAPALSAPAPEPQIAAIEDPA